MYVDDGAGVSVVDVVNGGEAGSRMVVQAAGCTKKMTLTNSDELQRRARFLTRARRAVAFRRGQW